MPPPAMTSPRARITRHPSGVPRIQGATIERLFWEMVQAGISRPRLDELFPGILGGLDEDLLRKVRLENPIVPPEVKWSAALPRLMASNNWVVHGSRTRSGKPILANDPHL